MQVGENCLIVSECEFLFFLFSFFSFFLFSQILLQENTVNLLGAKTIRAPEEAHYDTPQSHIGVAFQMRQENKDNSIVLDQVWSIEIVINVNKQPV